MVTAAAKKAEEARVDPAAVMLPWMRKKLQGKDQKVEEAAVPGIPEKVEEAGLVNI